jgi:HEAT repeat protein
MKKSLINALLILIIISFRAVVTDAGISIEEVLEKGPNLINEGRYRTVIEMIKALREAERSAISIQVLESFANLKGWIMDREVSRKQRWWELHQQQITASPDNQATLVLFSILKDSDSRVRYYAVEVLRSVGDDKAIPVLEELSERDGHHSVRSMAKKALNEIKERSRGIK